MWTEFSFNIHLTLLVFVLHSSVLSRETLHNRRWGANYANIERSQTFNAYFSKTKPKSFSLVNECLPSIRISVPGAISIVDPFFHSEIYENVIELSIYWKSNFMHHRFIVTLVKAIILSFPRTCSNLNNNQGKFQFNFIQFYAIVISDEG